MPKASMDLNGNWQFKEYPPSARKTEDLDASPWNTAKVPSSIFQALINVGKIKKSDIDANPENFAHISEKPWIFRKTFDAQKDLLACDKLDLLFEGLDTITTIWLNDKIIGKTNNMFIPFRFDITGLLKPKNNTLLVKFEPPIEYAKKMMGRYTVFDESAFTNPYRAYIRKAQFQFGWDFCPPLPGCGIWKPVRIEGIKKAKITDLYIKTVDCDQNNADIKVDISLDNFSKQDLTCKLILSDSQITKEHELEFQPADNFHSTVIRIHEPSLWFPAGYGEQHLYDLKCQLIAEDEIIDQKQKQFGIRTIKLNRSSNKKDEKFQFEINQKTIYAKGANWLPLSIFPGSATDQNYETILTDAANANINILRVWAGGYYENQKFYELCDQLGIMVWQDFMFTCAYYPDRPWFAEEIKKEASVIIKQLRNHPSLVLWCGNNEIDWMHQCSKLGKSKKFHGRKIYHQLLPRLLAEMDPNRPYIPTTPLGNSKNPNNPDCGTTHQWDIWTNHQPAEKYICPPEDIPQFVTEFGLQSLPDIKTVKKFCPPGELSIASKALEKHNYQLNGNSRLYRYMGDLFGPAKNPLQLVFLSQLTQARAAKKYIEYLRAHNFRNSGVLFWQLNDPSYAISWSAIDCNKEPKALYYYAKRFFSNPLITAVPQFENPKAGLPPKLQSLNVVVINDSEESLTVTLNCRLMDLAANLLDNVSLPVVIAPFSLSAPLKLPKSIVKPHNPFDSCLHLVMEKNRKKIAENLFFYQPDKYINWPKAKITTQLSQTNKEVYELKLKSDKLAKDVQITTTQPAKLSDNFIDLIPPNEFEITIKSNLTLPSLKSQLQIHSLNQIFYHQ